MFNIALVFQPWFSVGIHIDHTPPIYLAIHLPFFVLWIGWIDIIGATENELIWSMRPVKTVEIVEDK